ncbi:MAG: hypothetical protein RJA70_4597, partial [Pseudomonadota bacterium]
MWLVGGTFQPGASPRGLPETSRRSPEHLRKSRSAVTSGLFGRVRLPRFFLHVKHGLFRPPGRPLTVLRPVALACIMLGLWLWPSRADAYAWMLKHGRTKCASCHTDPSGGETLTHMGRVASQRLLSGTQSPYSDRAKFLFGLDEPDALNLGGSLRVLSLYSAATDEAPSKVRAFPMQADVYATAQVARLRAGLSLGYAQVRPASPHVRATQVTSNADGGNLISRWHWLGYELSDTLLLRGGRMNLPFGVRVPEHTLWTRDHTKTDRESDQEHGLALASWSGSWRYEFMFILGNFQVSPDRFRRRGYSVYLEHLVTPEFAVGLSSLVTQSEADRYSGAAERTLRQAHGATLRYGINPELACLGEFNALKTSRRAYGFAGFAMCDYEPWAGKHLQLTIEASDEGRLQGTQSGVGNGDLGLGTWASLVWFPVAHF